LLRRIKNQNIRLGNIVAVISVADPEDTLENLEFVGSVLGKWRIMLNYPALQNQVGNSEKCKFY